MSEWYDRAKARLESEIGEVKGRFAAAMKKPVMDTLLDFCRQDEEFAQAVVQGGSFPECMASVARGVSGSISDLDAYQRAVSYYFPGAKVHFHMTLDLCGERRDEDGGGAKIFNLTDFW